MARAAPEPTPTPSAPTAARFSQERRLEFIEFRLRWDGRLNRADLTDFFGISVPQASLDIARYVEMAGANLAYDRSSRVYAASEHFRPVFASSSPARFLDELLRSASSTEAGAPSVLGYRPPLAVVPSPGRTIDPDVIMALQRAIRERTGLRVIYQSLTRPEPTARTLSPHAFAHDGFRWHVRAYCHAREDFRDFVIARILEVEGPAPPSNGAPEDRAWNTRVTLVLAPHPKLPKAHRRAVELDYGMTDGEVGFTCRAALLFYALRHLRLDREDQAPAAQQIVLKNRREVERHLAAGGSG